MTSSLTKKPLSLKWLTTWLIGGSFFVFILVVLAFLYLKIPNLLQQGEDSYFKKELSSTETLIDDAIKKTIVESDNIAVWDQTASFVKGSNPSFIQDNWPNTTPLRHLGFNLILIKDRLGKDIYLDFYDKEKNKPGSITPDLSETVSDIADQVIKKYKPSSTHIESNGKFGALYYRNTLYLLSTMPIVENYDQKHPDGTVTVGYILDLNYFNKVMHQNISSFSVEMSSYSPSVKASFNLASESEVILNLPLKCIKGCHSLILHLNTPHIFYAQGKKTLNNISLFILVMIILLAIALGFILTKYYIRPLEQLNDEIASTSKNFSINSQKRENSLELNNLRTSINDMLTRLKDSDLAISTFQNIIAATDMRIYISDPETDRILFMNDHLLEDLGLTSTPTDKKCWEVLYPTQNKRCTVCPIKNLLHTGKPIVWDQFIQETGKNYLNTDSLITWFDGQTVHLHNRVDITQIKQAEEEHRFAMLDSLTGLNNRNAYFNKLAEVLKNPSTNIGVVFIDLNNLKYINDNYGHEQGDKYIHLLGKTLSRHFRHDDIFRIGGDEFIILSLNIPEDIFYRNIASLQKNCEEQFPKSISLGAVWSMNSIEVEALVRKADQLMSIEKKRLKETGNQKHTKWPFPIH